MKPLVSVIAVTNRPLFTPGLLKMFEAQTYPNLELILVDGSEGGRCIDRALGDIDWLGFNRQFQYIQVKPSAPVPAMRNIGMELANGEFMTWLDDDGWHAPHHIETVLGFLESEKADAAGIQGLYWTDLNGDFFHYRGTPNFPISGSMVWHRRCFEKFKFDTGKRKASDHYWINAIRMDKELRVVSVDDLTVCVAVSHGFNHSNPRPPSLARAVGNVSVNDFLPDEPHGLKQHLARINEAVKVMQEEKR